MTDPTSVPQNATFALMPGADGCRNRWL